MQKIFLMGLKIWWSWGSGKKKMKIKGATSQLVQSLTPIGKLLGKLANLSITKYPSKSFSAFFYTNFQILSYPKISPFISQSKKNWRSKNALLHFHFHFHFSLFTSLHFTIDLGESYPVPRCRRLTLQESTPTGYPTRRRLIPISSPSSSTIIKTSMLL